MSNKQPYKAQALEFLIEECNRGDYPTGSVIDAFEWECNDRKNKGLTFDYFDLVNELLGEENW